MLALLLPLTLIGLYSLSRRRAGRTDSIVLAILVFSCLVWGITEILSHFKMLSGGPVIICWLFFAVLCMICNLIIKNRVLSEDLNRCYNLFFGLLKGEKLIVLMAVAIYAGLVLLCPFIVNLNSDSMAYHFPRIMMWIQNHSVDYYVTGYPAQNFVPPFPDFIQMNLMLLSGCDRFQGMIQIISGLLVLIILLRLTFLITRSSAVVSAAAVIYLSIPIVIRESNTTQADLVASLYLICFVYVIYRISKEKVLTINRDVVLRIIAGGALLGILYISKSSLVFCAIVILLWFGIKRFFVNKDNIGNLVLLASFALVPFTLIILPMFLRNLSFGETAIAGNHFGTHMTGSVLPQYLLLNAYKNWAELAATPITSKLLLSIGETVGNFWGISINDELISFSKIPFMSNIKWYMDEDLSGAPVFMLISTIAFLILLFFIIRGIKSREGTINYADPDFLLVMFLQFLPLAMMTRWQSYGTRLMMPSLILTIIPASYMLVSCINKKCIAVLLVFGFIISIPCYFQAVKGAGRILSGKVRYDDYYVDVTGFTGIPLTEEYIENYNCHNIGFYGYNCFAYPQFKVFMKQDRRVEYTIPEEPIPGFVPDVLYSTGLQPYEKEQVLDYNGKIYKCSEIWGRNQDEALFEFQGEN